MSLNTNLDDLRKEINEDRDSRDTVRLILEQLSDYLQHLKAKLEAFEKSSYEERLDVRRKLGTHWDWLHKLDNEVLVMKGEKPVRALDVPIGPPKDRSAHSYVVTKPCLQRWTSRPPHKEWVHQKRKSPEDPWEDAMDKNCGCKFCNGQRLELAEKLEVEEAIPIVKSTKKARFYVPEVIDLTL